MKAILKWKVGVILISFGTIYGPVVGQNWKIYRDSAELNAEKNSLQSIRLLEKAYHLINKNENVKDFISLSTKLNDAYQYQEKYALAFEILDTLLVYEAKQLGKTSEQFVTTTIIYNALNLKLGRIAEASYRCVENVKIIDSLFHDKNTLLIKSKLQLAKVYAAKSNYLEEEKLYIALLNLALSSGDKSYVEQVAGDYYFKIGEFQKAESLLSSALEYWNNQVDDGGLRYINILNSLSQVYLKTGNYRKSENVLNRLHQHTSQLEGLRRLEYAKTLDIQASLYRKLGNFDKAESCYFEILGIYQDLSRNDFIGYAVALNNMANFYQSIGKYTQAENLFSKATQLILKLEGSNSRSYANALNNLAGLYRKTHKFEKAEKLYDQCLQIDEQTIGPFHPDYATTLNNLGILNTAQGKFDAGEDFYQKSLKIKKITLGTQHPSYSKTLNDLALLNLSRNRPDVAIPLMKQHLEIQLDQLKVVFDILSDVEKEGYYNILKDDIERFYSVLVTYKHLTPELLGFLYNLRIRTKSILFKASDKVRHAILNSGNKELIAQFEAWRHTREMLAFYYRLPKNEILRSWEQIKKLDEEANNLERKLSESSTLFQGEYAQEEINWKTIQKRLTNGSAAIEIIRCREYDIKYESQVNYSFYDVTPQHIVHGFKDNVNYAVLILTEETVEAPELVFLEEGNLMENDYFNYYKNAIQFEIFDEKSFKYFWEPISKKIKNKKTVYFSPDGIYHLINLNTLFDVLTNQFIIDQLDVHIVSNTKDIVQKKKTNGQAELAILVGNPDFNLSPAQRLKMINGEIPSEQDEQKNHSAKNTHPGLPSLPGTKIEVNAIDSILRQSQWKTRLLTGSAAIEDNIKKIKNPKILHIATHGYFDSNQSIQDSIAFINNPLLKSGLMLAGANIAKYDTVVNYEVDDGILTAFEAMNLYLDDTDLVILSACESGIGTIKIGEGIYGLQRAFQAAGAKNVIISLRKVNDVATQIMMTEFYIQWIQLGDIHQAFKAAQIQLRKIFKPSYFWGAFIMVGEV